MTENKLFACVMGDIDMLMPLGMAGIPCAVVARPGTMPTFSRYAKIVLDWSDPWTQPEKVVDTLLAFGRAQKVKPVVFYESDAYLLILSRFRRELSPYFDYVIPDAELVEDLVDKSRFQVLAESLGLSIPKARLLPAESKESWGALGLRFPIIVKPVTRAPDLWTPLGDSAKAVEIDTTAELNSFQERFAAEKNGLPLLVQELIPGPESAIESYHAYIDADGRIAGEFTGKKIRTYPVKLGHSCALETTEAADIAEFGRDVLRKLGLRGVAKVDIKRAPDGSLYLFEVNPRFNLWHHLGAAAGLNLPLQVYCDFAGQPRPAGEKVKTGVRWCRVWQDLRAARAEGVPLRQWLPWMLDCEVKRGLTRDNLMPLFYGGLWRASANLRRFLRPRDRSASEEPARGVFQKTKTAGELRAFWSKIK